MKENCKISVIVPAHNAENYIRECLESILGQTLKEFELICVNDGSTDGTEAVIRSYMEKDSRVSVINQENRYAGAARNTGMKAAQGTYLVFWDADDIFEPNALEELYRKSVEDQADVCVCDAVRFKDGSEAVRTDVKYLKERFMPEKIPFSIKDFPEYIFNFTTDVPWNKMYRRAFVEENQLEFEDRIRANDHYFVLQAFGLAKCITIVEKQLMRYRMNSGSSLTSGLSDSPLCTFEALTHAKETLEEKGVFQDTKAVQSFANRAVNSIVYAMEKQTGGEAFLTFYGTLKNGGFGRLLVTEQGEEYYYSTAVYEKYRRIMSSEPMEYLLAEYAAASDKLGELRPKLKNLRERFENLKAENKELKKAEKQLQKLQKELDYIHKKKWYRFIVFCAGLKNRITGKGK